MDEKYIEVVIIASSLLPMAWAVWAFFRNREKYARWNRADGMVVEHIPHKNREGSTLFALRISFQTETGETQAFVSSGASTLPRPVGETVEVIYNPENPQEALRNNFWSRHGFELAIFCFFGLACVLFGLKLGGVNVPSQGFVSIGG